MVSFSEFFDFQLEDESDIVGAYFFSKDLIFNLVISSFVFCIFIWCAEKVVRMIGYIPVMKRECEFCGCRETSFIWAEPEGTESKSQMKFRKIVEAVQTYQSLRENKQESIQAPEHPPVIRVLRSGIKKSTPVNLGRSRENSARGRKKTT